MKEQSHKDEMSAALRGDFQRLRERGVAVTLAPSEPGPAPPPSAVEEPLTDMSDRAVGTDEVSDTESGEALPSAVLAEAVSDTDLRQDVLSDAAEADAADDESDAARGWLGRLLGR